MPCDRVVMVGCGYINLEHAVFTYTRRYYRQPIEQLWFLRYALKLGDGNIAFYSIFFYQKEQFCFEWTYDLLLSSY